MDVLLTHCAGLDVHKKTVVACCFTPDGAGQKQKAIRTFGTVTKELLLLSDWLLSQGVTHVAMESTGEFWKPVYNILEGNFELLVVNAQHIKNVPGRKTDVKDAEWIAELLRHGLVRSSFIPSKPQRALRDLTRQRTNLVQNRAMVVNWLQKACEDANIKLSSVATDITGVSGRTMLEALLQGHSSPQQLAQLAKGKLRNKLPELELALDGIVQDHHRFLISNHLAAIDFLDERIAAYDQYIADFMAQMPPLPPAPPTDAAPTDAAPTNPTSGADAPVAEAQPPLSWDEAVTLLDTIPGVNRRMAEQLLAEIGIDMRRFPSEAHLASWAKLSPGNNESGGKRYPGTIGHGNHNLRSSLVQAAWASIKVKTSYLATLYYRLVGRRGKKRAIIAVAHRILIAIYHMLTQREPFRDLGATYRDKRRETTLIRNAQRRFKKLGYIVQFEPAPGAAVPN